MGKTTKNHSFMRSVIFTGGILIMLFIFVLTWTFFPRSSSEVPESSLIPELDEDQELVMRLDAENLLQHVKDLYRIKQSVLKQLRDLEKKGALISSELIENDRRVKELKQEIFSLNETCVMLQRAAHFFALESGRSPEIGKPLRLFADSYDKLSGVEIGESIAMDFEKCSMDACFDYSKCPVTSGFPVFVDSDLNSLCTESELLTALYQSPYILEDPEKACVHLVIVCSESQLTEIPKNRHWGNNGSNFVLILNQTMDLSKIGFGRAIIVSSTDFLKRPAYDILIPRVFESTSEILDLPAQVPARRKILLYFSGFRNSTAETSTTDGLITDVLKGMKASSVNPMEFALEFSCVPPAYIPTCLKDAWCSCEHVDAFHHLGNSTFSLALWTNFSDDTAMDRIIRGLKYGAIPVILGYPRLPFEETIDWLKAVIRLPKARTPELHWILRSIRDEDILAYRYNGRRIWESYFSSPASLVKTTLEVIRQRLNIPAAPAIEFPSLNPFNETSQPQWVMLTPVVRKEDTEILGPVEFPYSSATFQRNFTSTTLDRYDAWNVRFSPGVLLPSTPFSPVLPSDAKFKGSEYGFRPLGGGAGGTGPEFREALSGNYPREQFTVVILTYQRESVLSVTLANLNNLSYLHKVVIIWNSAFDSLEPLSLPKLHVAIHVHKSMQNSLNNRFLPLDVIETECVLHLDDDVRLRHDEIILAFRVWRENRERIVGFPARYHAWDAQHRAWLYNSNYSCEYSMILTGAAFLHKYYMHLYTSTMPAVIRHKVDEYQNCEDIAMNFLVAHHTRKPPIKVTSRWTFPCPDCGVSLWEDNFHFQERHHCIQLFEKVYGYMPLLSTQFRADSVLFKTRIPADKQKCFKYV